MRTLNILFVTPQYPPAVGGTEQLTALWAHELHRRGHRTVIYTTRSTDQPTWTGKLPSASDDNGIYVRRFTQIRRGPRMMRLMHWGYSNFARTGAMRHEAGVWLSEGPIAPEMLVQLLRGIRTFDVVITMSSSTFTSLATSYVARIMRTPYINVPLLHLDQLTPAILPQQRHLLRHSATLLPLTVIEADALTSRYGVPAHIIQVTPPIVTAPAKLPSQAEARAKLNLAKDAFVIFFLARKVAYKGFKDVVLAHRVRSAVSGRQVLCTAGPGTEFATGVKRDLSDTPRWLDFETITEDEKWLLFAAADVFAMPSSGESFGIVYAEAWLTGKPVIGAASGAVTGVIANGQDGFVVPPHDVHALAARFELLESNPWLVRHMGEQGRVKSGVHFSAARVGDILEGELSQAIRRYRHTQQSVAASSKPT